MKNIKSKFWDSEIMEYLATNGFIVGITEVCFISVLIVIVGIFATPLIARPVNMERTVSQEERVALDQAKKDRAYMSDDDFAASVASAKNFDEFKAVYVKKHASDKMKAEKIKSKKIKDDSSK